jgi:hypothetical protein
MALMTFRNRLKALEQRYSVHRVPPPIEAALVDGDLVVKVFRGGRWQVADGLKFAELPRCCKLYAGLDWEAV